MMYPCKVPAIKVNQPLGTFFIVSLPANLLLDTCHSIKTELLDEVEETPVHPLGSIVDKIKGTQRERASSRLEQIRLYSETVDACFPNAIILGANYDEKGMLVTDAKKRWSIEEGEHICYLTIPSKEKLASIIDGQHRVFGFEKSKNRDMHLLCSVFIDLPMPYHAQLFTKINTTQKRVDKNLAYNLFQFDMEQGDSKSWAPEILAVYFARVLESDDGSPLKGVIKLGVTGANASSTISMASVIDGILALITSNAEKDRSIMHTISIKSGRSRRLLAELPSSAPLRPLFITNKDKTLYDIICSYLRAVKKVLWKGRGKDSIFRRTLGIQACFDYLKEVSKQKGHDFSYTEEFFVSLLSSAQDIDFENEFYGVQTKVRSRIKNTLFVVTGLKDISELRCSREDKLYLEKVLSK